MDRLTSSGLFVTMDGILREEKSCYLPIAFIGCQPFEARKFVDASVVEIFDQDTIEKPAGRTALVVMRD